METRWVTVDGVRVELPADCTAGQLRDALYKPSNSTVVAVTGDLVSVVHDDDKQFSEMVAGCAETYYFTHIDEPHRNAILETPEIEQAIAEPVGDETTFQRPEIDH
ncbi:hypothetical protein G6M89_10215 [Natronolimnobius sp. AArcel1]|uniref:hypothetical protein n=1 Tax=Natronolimnobius sp. AArcel1 TaxID=1679093 RepID=UPI0013EB5941|nr:hypothetical protein [Natronolimnobius sp. AArcel1]NGM69377.1 hypothetical protein [Natronolimnobius sp. AArcel1]